MSVSCVLKQPGMGFCVEWQYVPWIVVEWGCFSLGEEKVVGMGGGPNT